MNVHQLSISYVAEQDRILVRVHTSDNRELQFWLTRRLTLGLTPALDQIVTAQAASQVSPASTPVAPADEPARKAMAQFQRGKTLQSADFATPYQGLSATAQLFDSPLLVTEVNLTAMANAQLQLRCAEKLGDGAARRHFQMALSEQLAHAFAHLLARALTQSQWHLTTAGAPVPVEPGPAADKPNYLN